MKEFRNIEGGFPDADLRDLHELVSRPSWFDPEKGIDESAVADFIEQRLQNCGCNVWTMPVEGKRHNVIAEKGNGDYVIWIMAHMDTNEPEDGWDIGCSLEQSQNGDALTGVGAWDMKIGVLQMMKLAREVEVPDGVKFIFIFPVDEEIDSKGINAVLAYPDFPQPQFVVGPEIPVESRPELLEGGRKHPIIIARRGHAKFKGNVQVQSSHAGKRNAPQATVAYREAMNNLFEKVYKRKKVSPEDFLARRQKIEVDVRKKKRDMDEGALQEEIDKRWTQYLLEHSPRHELFTDPQNDERENGGVEDLIEYASNTVRRKSKYLSVPKRQEYELSHMFGPGMTVEDAVRLKVALRRNIEVQCGYVEKQIKWVLAINREREQYEAYVMDTNHPLMEALARAVDNKHSDRGASHIFAASNSTSDMNKIAEAGFVGAEVAGTGRNEHSDGETASNRESYRNYEVLKRFLTVEAPQALHEANDG